MIKADPPSAIRRPEAAGKQVEGLFQVTSKHIRGSFAGRPQRPTEGMRSECTPSTWCHTLTPCRGFDGAEFRNESEALGTHELGMANEGSR